MSERKLIATERANIRSTIQRRVYVDSSLACLVAALDDLDTADAEIAAQQQHAKDLERLYLELRAQMAGMVTLEQVEHAVRRTMTMPFIVEAGAGAADIIKDTIMDSLRQSTPTEKE